MIRVLVVDDDADLLDMVTLMLQSYEMEVTPLLDGIRFFDTIKSAVPDIIIMDIILGDCDGRDLCKELKNDKRHSCIPVILFSATDISKDMLDEEGANYFLRKPFEMDVLVGRILDLAA